MLRTWTRHSVNFVRFTWIAVCCLLFGSVQAGDEEPRSAKETVDYYLKLLVNESKDEATLQEFAETIVRDLLDIKRLAPQVLQNEWGKINEVQKERFIEAFTIELQREAYSKSKEYQDMTASSLRLRSDKTKSHTATLSYKLSAPNKDDLEFDIRMLKYPDGTWRVVDLRSDKESLLRSYYNYSKDTIEDYSFGVLVAELGNYDRVILEDFEGQTVGTLPDGWEWRGSDDDKHKPYEVREENGNRYLAAEDNGESVILGKDLSWNLNEYPYFSFKWRVRKIPEGGDERYGRTVDSAAGIYLSYKKTLGAIPVSIKFVWSSTLPVGSATRRSGIGKPWMVVAGSGKDKLGQWQTFVFDARQAYRDTFGGDPPDKPVGIGILSDANSTNSQAYADYDDILALKYADADSGVKKKLEAE